MLHLPKLLQYTKQISFAALKGKVNAMASEKNI